MQSLFGTVNYNPTLYVYGEEYLTLVLQNGHETTWQHDADDDAKQIN